MRTIRRALDRLPLYWEAGLRRLPFFTQRTAVLLLGVLVAALAMVGGVVALVGWPGANGPAHLVPGERAGLAPESRPEPGDRPAPGSSGAGVRSGADAGGATAASPSPANQPAHDHRRPGGRRGQGSRGHGPGTAGGCGAAPLRCKGRGHGLRATRSGGAAGAGAGARSRTADHVPANHRPPGPSTRSRAPRPGVSTAS